MSEDIITHGIKATSRPEIRKGDFVEMSSGFVGVVADNQTKSKTRMVHVFGYAEETGSVYASDMHKISQAEFENAKTAIYHNLRVAEHGQWSREEMNNQERKSKKLKEMS